MMLLAENYFKGVQRSHE